ncbi:glutathione S-transferase kappa 1-like [Carassius carassius]|uniref:glutathione S-transferase kappa 1-like n=1 Tax=Carassius carassius TaxID=217509 RepID=UPI00286870AA|nr:glutathione S-transferase kappa 1-like [Carassius carassius]XP_059423059.1 glutathione S-transferase kappa 1-like [Carassius carassius]
MSNSRKVVKLFYDIISPYSWLAFEVLCRYRNVWNIDLKFKPALLGAVFRGSGNQEPRLIQNKFSYMVTDLKQMSELFGVPVNPPLPCKKGTLNVMRFVTAVAEKEEERGVLVERVSRELWKNIWSTHQDISHPALLTEAGLKAGLSANEVEELLILSKSQQIKDKLKSVTQEALDYRSFGLPFIVCHVNGKAEVFFGSDRFELMAHRIGEKWVGPHPVKTLSQNVITAPPYVSEKLLCSLL